MSATSANSPYTPDGLNTTAPSPKRQSKRTLIIALIALFVVLLVAGIAPRVHRSNAALAHAQEVSGAVPVVSVTRVQDAPPTSQLSLPANIQAVTVASIYARSNGYVKRRYVDIGTRVKAGQLLAVIESPEVDQELLQARASLEQTQAALKQANANLAQAQAALSEDHANLQQAEANQEIARITATRWEHLVAKGVLSKQQGDERRTDYDARKAAVLAAQASINTGEATVQSQQANVTAARANIDAQAANVRRLEEMRGFERVVAPFDGVITQRKVEQGDLITSGSGSDKNLFSVAQPNLLRIQVNVPQSNAIDVKVGDVANVTVQELPGSEFTGKIVRTADALDPAARTLLTEVYVENKDGRLLPGMYGQVKFHLRQTRKTVILPTDALIVDGEGTRVATVTPGHVIHFVSVQPGHDFGTSIEVLDGLENNATVVSNPPDTLTEGEHVNVQNDPGAQRSKL